MQKRETVTNRLADVIHLVQLARKTAALIVERGEGTAYEEGIIIFDNGQVTEATTGQRRGLEALNWLESWGTCRFALDYSFTTSSSAFNAQIHNSRLNGNSRELVQPEFSSPPTGIPSHTRHINELLPLIEQMGFSRAHRRLFLLIDERRSDIMLTRLMGRESDEVYMMLNELEKAGFIQR